MQNDSKITPKPDLPRAEHIRQVNLLSIGRLAEGESHTTLDELVPLTMTLDYFMTWLPKRIQWIFARWRKDNLDISTDTQGSGWRAFPTLQGGYLWLSLPGVSWSRRGIQTTAPRLMMAGELSSGEHHIALGDVISFEPSQSGGINEKRIDVRVQVAGFATEEPAIKRFFHDELLPLLTGAEVPAGGDQKRKARGDPYYDAAWGYMEKGKISWQEAFARIYWPNYVQDDLGGKSQGEKDNARKRFRVAMDRRKKKVK